MDTRSLYSPSLPLLIIHIIRLNWANFIVYKRSNIEDMSAKNENLYWQQDSYKRAEKTMALNLGTSDELEFIITIKNGSVKIVQKLTGRGRTETKVTTKPVRTKL